MNYVYDILVNLNEELYDFYDWEETDNFVHIRRVPMYKVSEEDYVNFAVKKVKLSEELLSVIRDKTQVFSSRNIETIEYSLVVCDGKRAILIEFDSKGNSYRKSKFLVNEEMEIVDVCSSLKECKLDYSVVSNKVKRNVMIRKERVILNNILKELSCLKEDKKKIDYLYYEWFDKKSDNNSYEELVQDLKVGFTNKHLEFLELLNLLTIKK